MDAGTVEDTTPDLGDSKVIDIVLSILNKCRFETQRRTIFGSICDFEGRVSHYTGIPTKMLKQIQKVQLNPQPVDFNTHVKILQCLLQFYKNKELPSFRLLFKSVNEAILTVQDYEQFKQDATAIGIGFERFFNKTILLMEDPKITFERYSYLKRMNQIRQQKKHVYYITERVIDKERKFDNPWKNNELAEISDKYVFFLAISSAGFTNGLFCYAPTEQEFYKWIADILIRKLEYPSFVVMDNSPLHGKSKFCVISRYNTKTDMINWLRKQNVPCSDAMNKSELYELIIRHPSTEELCRVDRILEAYGHEVLRLPMHFEDLSPIESVWQDIRETFVALPLHEDILNTLKNMPTENYQFYEKEIVERENQMFLLDTEMDSVLDGFMMDLKACEAVNTSEK